MRPQHVLNLGYTPTHPLILGALAAALRPEPAPPPAEAPLFDPCAGEGDALAALAEALKAAGARTRTFGVELEPGRAEKARKRLDFVLCADFRITAFPRGAFALALINPPYDPTAPDPETAGLEAAIALRAADALAPGGLGIFLVPRRLLQELRWLSFRWLALRTSPDPASPSQVLLVGRAGEWSELPPELPFAEPLPPLPVPLLKPQPIRLTRTGPTPEETAAFLADLPPPDPTARFGTGRGAAVPAAVHPLKAGHRAALLAAWDRTLDLGTAAVRAAVRRETTRTTETDGEGRTVIRTTHRPVLVLRILTPGGLKEAGLEELRPLAGAVDRALQVRPRTAEPPTPAEARVLEELGKRLPPLPGGPPPGWLPAQTEKALGLGRTLRRERRALLVAEMGFGKTPIALAARTLYLEAHRRRRTPTLTAVLCPPHLVPKWVREIKRLLPGAAVFTPAGDGEARLRAVRQAFEAAREGTPDVFLVLSREAAKLGPEHRPGLMVRFLPAAGRVYACPTCGRLASAARAGAGEGYLQARAFRAPLTPAQRERLRAAAPGDRREELLNGGGDPPPALAARRCPDCRTPYRTAVPSPRRWPLADLARRLARRTGVGVFLIADEAHEYRGASLQGEALGKLLSAAERALLLTGTLFGGKASELYRLLRFAAPEFNRLGLSEQEFVAAYGVLEAVERPEDERRVYGRFRTRAELKERPGISPAVFTFLLPRTAFGSLGEVARGLPPYAEARRAVPLDGAFPPEALAALAPGAAPNPHGEDGMARLAAWLEAALGYPNAAAVPPADGSPHHAYGFVRRTRDYYEPCRTETVLTLPVLPEGTVLPKEAELIRLLKAEKARGRKAVVLVRQTRLRPVGRRLEGLLREAGIRAAFLDPQKVPPGEREAWVERTAHRLDALIVHPKAVETGLDLVRFQTAVLYEVFYSAVTVLQAVRRLYRLGQDREVKVLVLAYEKTLEPPAWDLIAHKVSWATSLYGDFLASGLGAVADQELDILRDLAARLGRGERPAPEPAPALTLAGLPEPPRPGPTPAPAEPPLPAGLRPGTQLALPL